MSSSGIPFVELYRPKIFEDIVLDPLNKQIEKLAKEEQELYEQIKMAHPNLSDEQIVTSVRNRLIQEGLVEDSVMNSARYINRRN